MNDATPTMARYRVSGRVQGVYYRASTREQALKLGLRGYAKNLADGSVEVLAIGATVSIAELERWLWQGPGSAAVSNVEKLPPPTGASPEITGFITL